MATFFFLFQMNSPRVFMHSRLVFRLSCDCFHPYTGLVAAPAPVLPGRHGLGVDVTTSIVPFRGLAPPGEATPSSFHHPFHTTKESLSRTPEKSNQKKRTSCKRDPPFTKADAAKLQGSADIEHQSLKQRQAPQDGRTKETGPLLGPSTQNSPCERWSR